MQKLADRLDQQRVADDALKLRVRVAELEEALAAKAKEADEWRRMYLNPAEDGSEIFNALWQHARDHEVSPIRLHH